MQTVISESVEGLQKYTIEKMVDTQVRHGFSRMYAVQTHQDVLLSEELYQLGRLVFSNIYRDNKLTEHTIYEGSTCLVHNYYPSGNIGGIYSTNQEGHKIGNEVHYHDELDRKIKALIQYNDQGQIHGVIQIYNTEGRVCTEYTVANNWVTCTIQKTGGRDQVSYGGDLYVYDVFFDEDVEDSIQYHGSDEDYLDTYIDWIPSQPFAIDAPTTDSQKIGLNSLSIDIVVQECCICFKQDHRGILTPCNHEFCNDCIQHWINDQHSNQCPTCRQVM